MHWPKGIAVVGLLALGVVTAAPAPFQSRVGTASKGGLALTVRLDKKSYQPTDELKLSFQLKNESNKDLYVGDGFMAPSYNEAGPGRHFEVHVVAHGKGPLYFWSGVLTECSTSGIRKVFRLRPGEVYAGSIVLLSSPAKDPFIKRPDDRGGTFEDRGTRKGHVLGKDGRKYTVALRYQVLGRGAWQPPAGFKDEQLWKGELTSNPIEFEVVEK